MTKTKFNIGDEILVPFKINQIRIKDTDEGGKTDYWLAIQDGETKFAFVVQEEYLKKYAKIRSKQQ